MFFEALEFSQRMGLPLLARFMQLQSWEGTQPSEVEIAFTPCDDHVVVSMKSPFYNDPAPLPFQLQELWNHEVVEVFFKGSEERYLEIEVSP